MNKKTVWNFYSFFFFIFFIFFFIFMKKNQKVFFISYFVQGFNLLPAFRYIVTYYLHMVQIRNATVCSRSLVKSTPFCRFCQFLFIFAIYFSFSFFLKFAQKQFRSGHVHTQVFKFIGNV
jgi:hypothetical protein